MRPGESETYSPPLVARAMTESIDFSRRRPACTRPGRLPSPAAPARPPRCGRSAPRSGRLRSTSASVTVHARAARSRRAPARWPPPLAPARAGPRGTPASRCRPAAGRFLLDQAARELLHPPVDLAVHERAGTGNGTRAASCFIRSARTSRSRRVPRLVLEILAHARRAAPRAFRTRPGPWRTRRRAPARTRRSKPLTGTVYATACPPARRRRSRRDSAA